MSNQSIDRVPAHFGNIETSHLEIIKSENIRHLRQLATLTGANQDIVRSKPVFSPNGQYLAVAGVSAARIGSFMHPEACGNIWLWNIVRGGIKVLRIPEARPIVSSLDFSPDSTLLLSNEYRTADRTAITRTWSINGENVEQTQQAPISVETLQNRRKLNSQNDQVFAVYSGSQFIVLDAETGEEIRRVQLDDEVEQIDEQSIVMPFSDLIVAITSNGVSIWDSAGDYLTTFPNTSQFDAGRFNFSPDKKILIVVGKDYSHYRKTGKMNSTLQVWGVLAQP